MSTDHDQNQDQEPAGDAEIIPFAGPESTAPESMAQPTDYFVRRDGLVFAGTHLLIDVQGAKNLDDIDHISAMLRAAVDAVGATLLRLDLHHFDENGGISGVAVLAESHMSIHTWPEVNYAALDVFVCGTCDAYKAIPVFKAALEPESLQVSEHKRGMIL